MGTYPNIETRIDGLQQSDFDFGLQNSDQFLQPHWERTYPARSHVGLVGS